MFSSTKPRILCIYSIETWYFHDSLSEIKVDSEQIH